MAYGIRVLITGSRACFTRPEFKAERMSYDVITPSAARGIIEAIHWKPAIRWIVDRIEVLNEIQFDTFRRNEVGGKISYANAKNAEKGSPRPLVQVASYDRQQRATTMLRNVAYVVDAHFEMTEKAGPDDTPEKHLNIVCRRLRNGQCFNQPCLGCREFPATVELLEEGCKKESFYTDVDEKDFGFMLYDMDFRSKGKPIPRFYRAVMRNGVIDVAAVRAEVKP